MCPVGRAERGFTEQNKIQLRKIDKLQRKGDLATGPLTTQVKGRVINSHHLKLLTNSKKRLDKSGTVRELPFII